MVHRIPGTTKLFIRSMGKLLRVTHLTDSEKSTDELKKINPDFVVVATSEDPKRKNSFNIIAHAYEPDHTPTLAKAIPPLVIRCVNELDTFVHCLLIDSQLDPQRRAQLREIAPLVQDARNLCIPGPVIASEVAKVRYSYMTEQCQKVIDFARKMAAMSPAADPGKIAEAIQTASELAREFPEDA